MAEMSAITTYFGLKFNQRTLRWAGALALAGLVIGAWWMYSPAGLLGKADAVGYSVCHRIELRSFHLGERPLPLCSRCTGMYLGAIFGLVYFAAVGKGKAGRFPPRRIMLALGVFGLGFAFDGLNAFLHDLPGVSTFYEPSNLMRLISGTGMGLALGTLLYVGFNQNAWRDWGRQSPVKELKGLVPLLLVGAAIVLLVLTENDLILYPLALLSSLGVLVLLAGVYTTMVLLILRRENQADGWRDLLLPITLGLTLAVLQIGAIDLARYLATGTWAGFTL